MADESIVFHAEIDKNGQAAKSLSQLKKEFKETQKELDGAVKGTEAYRSALSKLAHVKDEIEDLNDEIKGFQGAGQFQAFSNVASSLAGGFQAATAAASLFGVQSEEVEQALLKIQAAMALTDGIKAIEGMGQSLMVVGNVIRTNVVTAFSTLKGAIAATGIGALVIAIGVLINETMKYNEAIEEEYDKQRKLNEELKKTTDEYLKQAVASEKLRNARRGGLNELERELSLLEASGASAEQIAQKKQDIIDKEIFNLKVRRSTIEGNAEMEAELTEQILDKENEKQALILANELRKREEYRKTQEEKARIAEADFQAAVAHGNKLDDLEAERSEKDRQKAKEEREEFQRIFEEEDKKRVDAEAAEEEQRLKNELFLEEMDKRENARLEDKIAKEKAAAEEIANLKLQIENASFTALKGVSDLYFMSQLNSVKGNAKAELEIRKKQFNVEKAFNVARGTIDGIRSVMAAMTIPPPFGQILAGINAGIAAVNVGKILAQKFDGGSVDVSAPSSNTPNVSTPQTAPPNVTNATTQLNEQGQNLTVKAEFVETQATRTQGRVKRLQDQSTF